MTRAEEIIWAAGFLDGEGCFWTTWSNERTGSMVLSLQVSQVVIEPLEDLQRLFGGHVGIQRRAAVGQRGTWQWRLSGVSSIVAVLDEIEPYLHVKREQSKVMRRLCNTVAQRNGKVVPPILKARRKRLLREMYCLRRGTAL